MKADVVRCSVLNSLNNLLGYPHAEGAWVEQQLGAKLIELDDLWARASAWMGDRGEDRSYFDRIR